jgi:hypothetical protein
MHDPRQPKIHRVPSPVVSLEHDPHVRHDLKQRGSKSFIEPAWTVFRPVDGPDGLGHAPVDDGVALQGESGSEEVQGVGCYGGRCSGKGSREEIGSSRT